MNYPVRLSALVGLALITSLIAGPVAAQVNVAARATANATVQPGGPRTGASGTNFFNIEGINNGTFSSYGVIDFSGASFGISGVVTDVSSLVLRLQDAPATFSANGSVNFYLATNNTTSISNNGSSPLTFNTSLSEGINPTSAGQLGILYALGSGTYNNSNITGTNINYSLNLTNPTGKSLFINNLNAKSTIRLVVTPGNNATAATYLGTTSNQGDSPRLSFTATLQGSASTPEPGAVSLMILGMSMVGYALHRPRIK